MYKEERVAVDGHSFVLITGGVSQIFLTDTIVFLEPSSGTMKYLHHLLLAASAANAHSLFQQLWVAAEDKGTSCARVPKSNSPVTNLGGADMRCNAGPAKASATCSIDAGESLTVEMHPQPNGERKCGKDSAIGGNHYGPVIVYMSKVANAATADGSSDWFKVAEDGLDPSITTTDAWGTEKMNKNCGKKSFISMTPALKKHTRSLLTSGISSQEHSVRRISGSRRGYCAARPTRSAVHDLLPKFVASLKRRLGYDLTPCSEGN